MNLKRFIPAVIAVFAVVFLYDWVLHGVVLSDAYQATAHLWRPEAQMQEYFMTLVLGQFIFAAFFCLIFLKGYENKGVFEGARYGIYVALLLASRDIIIYAVQPIPETLVLSWIVGMLGECILAGMVLAMIYRR